MSNEPLDYVSCYCDTITLKTPKSREKNEGRRYLDYCEIITTEYKWTTNYFRGFLLFSGFLIYCSQLCVNLGKIFGNTEAKKPW